MQVKKNQKTLYQKIEQAFKTEITLKHNSTNPEDVAITTEKNKGRQETRVCYKTSLKDQDWKGLQTVVLIQTLIKEKTKNKTKEKTKNKTKEKTKNNLTGHIGHTGHIGKTGKTEQSGKTGKTEQTKIKEKFNQQYFISSQDKSPDYYLTLKRKHWSIEAFHYIKDVTYGEDASKAIQGQAAQNQSFIRSLAINLYKSIGSTNQAQSLRLYGNNIPKLFEIIQSVERMG